MRACVRRGVMWQSHLMEAAQRMPDGGRPRPAGVFSSLLLLRLRRRDDFASDKDFSTWFDRHWCGSGCAGYLDDGRLPGGVGSGLRGG